MDFKYYKPKDPSKHANLFLAQFDGSMEQITYLKNAMPASIIFNFGDGNIRLNGGFNWGGVKGDDVFFLEGLIHYVKPGPRYQYFDYINVGDYVGIQNGVYSFFKQEAIKKFYNI